ncbi:MAG TPA: RhuM family protein, partial [Prolixibacteraceae bacterium]|nr:RhuM family protein [Prolixibacteraceae bacterium]
MKIVKVLICGLLLTAFLFFSLGRAFGQLFINEFMASNTGIVSDPDYGESADWIEIYNGSQQTVNLQGYSLTDNISDLYKWTFTGRVNLLPGACLLIWADGMNTGLHTGFKLSADGEELALVSPTGEIVDSLSFSFQEANISMGRKTDGASEWVFFTEPTPGRQNGGEAFAGIVKSEPTFSRLGGIFAAPLSLSIRSLYGGIVRYTLDGTEPSETAPVASSNLTINKTTVVRARIYKEGELRKGVTVKKYLTVQKEAKRMVSRYVEVYNLDVIISVGYRVKSKRGTQFRQWATQQLKDHLIRGYTLNEKRLQLINQNMQQLEQAVKLIQQSGNSEQLNATEAKGLLEIITNYTQSFILLNQFD